MPAKPAYLDRLRLQVESTPGARDEWTPDELRDWALDLKGDKASTVAQRLRDLARLATHPICPVRMHHGRWALVESFIDFYRYRRDVEGQAGTALVNDSKAIKYLGRFLGIPETVWPVVRRPGRRARKVLPSPEEVHALVHHRYAPKGSYEGALVKWLLVADIALAVRAPSELHAMTVGDVDVDRHLLLVREPKKGDTTRWLRLQPEWICCGKNAPSLAWWLAWRAKVDVGGTDKLFLKPNGEPFASERALSRWLTRRVKPHFPWFHMYLGRVWGANARLIDGGMDYAAVAQWLGHESVDQLRRSYEHDAEIHRDLYGRRWLDRALLGRVGRAQAPKTPVPPHFPLMRGMLPPGSTTANRRGKGGHNSRNGVVPSDGAEADSSPSSSFYAWGAAAA